MVRVGRGFDRASGTPGALLARGEGGTPDEKFASLPPAQRLPRRPARCSTSGAITRRPRRSLFTATSSPRRRSSCPVGGTSRLRGNRPVQPRAASGPQASRPRRRREGPCRRHGGAARAPSRTLDPAPLARFPRGALYAVGEAATRPRAPRSRPAPTRARAPEPWPAGGLPFGTAYDLAATSALAYLPDRYAGELLALLERNRAAWADAYRRAP